MTIPVSVLITVKNESARITACLAALQDFDEIIVIDSESADDTAVLATQAGATVVSYIWNGQYPKKRQWCLDRLVLRHDWIFFVDADEIIPENLVVELKALFEREPAKDGYFVRGLYVVDGKTLRHGLGNNKLALFDRRRFEFPVVNDLGLHSMGEMEGHYQPVPKDRASIGFLKTPLLHKAYTGSESWISRHQRYAVWEAGMNERNAWPVDPIAWRQILKRGFRRIPCRSLAAFCHCYIYKLGFLDGRPGWLLARDRYAYYKMIANAGRQIKKKL